jgi:hypothetical protein
MSDRFPTRERVFWVVLVAVLATSLAWLAAVSAALAVQAFAPETARALVVFRVLFRAAMLVVQQGWALVPAAIILWALLGWAIAAVQSEGRQKREVNHA